jgi:hypothetical protein
MDEPEIKAGSVDTEPDPNEPVTGQEIGTILLQPNALGNAWVPHLVYDFAPDIQRQQADCLASCTNQALQFARANYLTILDVIAATNYGCEFHVYNDVQHMLVGQAIARIFVCTKERYEQYVREAEEAPKVATLPTSIIVPADYKQ